MSSEVHKYIETALKNKEDLLNAEVINFPFDNKQSNSKDIEANNFKFWKLYDKNYKNEDGDQLRAVLGICLMFGTLAIIGLYSSFA
tara:strand:+ start:702 stop:959 length:258 start_codon:yes stop_codon:yes gene_type:complete